MRARVGARGGKMWAVHQLPLSSRESWCHVPMDSEDPN